MSSLYVLIPTHGRAPLLERTLASLAQCERPEGYVETVVVENGSKEGAEAICQQADARLKVRYMHVEKANKSHALNEALRAVPEDALVVFFDDDVRFAPEVLTAYAEATDQQNSPRAYFGGPVEVDYEEEPFEWLKPHFPRSVRGWRIGPGEAPKMFLGANWAAYAHDLRAIDGFNLAVGPGQLATGQESDAQRRLREAGIAPVYVPDARVWHYVPRDRCSPAWALGRRYKAGVAEGQLDWDAGKISLRQILRTFYKIALAGRALALNREDGEAAFAERCSIAYHRGRLRAYWRKMLGQARSF